MYTGIEVMILDVSGVTAFRVANLPSAVQVARDVRDAGALLVWPDGFPVLASEVVSDG